jgi:uncharacterized repeat protein (TIGR01451 family)
MNGRVFSRFLMTLTLLSVFALPALAQEADLLLTKDGPAQAAAGSNVSYTVTVTNLGPDDATTVVLNDPIPEGMTFTSWSQDTGPTFACTDPGVGNGGTVNCTIATLPSGISASFTFVFNISPQTPPGTTFTNMATVSSGVFDPNEENNTGIVGTSTPPPPSADLAVSKSGPTAAGPDSDIVYTITVTNSGPDAAANVSMSDTLPGTLTFVSFTQDSGPVFNCGVPGTTTTCTLASMNPGQIASFTVTAHIPPATPSGTQYENQASITSSNDPNPENDLASVVTVVSSVDLSITKTGPPSVTAGATISYTITVANAGPDAASTVYLDDTVPAGTTFLSLVQNNGPGFTCVTPPPGGQGTISCSVPSMGSGASSQFTLVLTTTGSTASVSNTATVAAPAEFDSNPANNSANAVTTVNPSADLQIVKTGPGAVTAGQTIAYSIVVTNAGPSPATTAAFTDTLPANTTLAAFSQTAGPLFNCTAPAVGGTGAINCSIATLSPSASATFALTLNVAPSASGTVDNTATATTATSDPNGGNNTSNTSAVVSQSADVSVTKSGPATVNAGATISYTVTVANAGPSNATAVALNDTLPANTTFASSTQNSGPTFSCTTPAVGGTGPITCTIATLTPATSATFTIVLNVTTAATGTVTNTATVTSTTADPTPGNNSANTAATVTQSADLSIVKTGPATVTSGNNITYTLTATNAGPSDATTVAINDTTPAGTTFVSFTQTSGAPFICTTPAVGGTGAVNCTLALFAAGGSATFDLVVAVPQAATGAVSNTATISSATTDPTPANNSSTVPTAINAGPTDVSIVKTANTTTVPAGGSVTYTIVVTNNGPSVAVNTVVTDVLPSGMTATSATSTQGTCSGTTTVTCNVGLLLTGANATITLVATVPAVAGPVTNTATVAITNTNTNPGGGSSSAAIGVSSGAGVPALSPEAMALLALLLGAVAFRAMKS